MHYILFLSLLPIVVCLPYPEPIGITNHFSVNRYNAVTIFEKYGKPGDYMPRASFNKHLALYSYEKGDLVARQIFRCRSHDNQTYYLVDFLSNPVKMTSLTDTELRRSMPNVRFVHLMTPTDSQFTPQFGWDLKPHFYTFRKVYDDCKDAVHVGSSHAGGLIIHPPTTRDWARHTLNIADEDARTHDLFIFHESLETPGSWILHIRKRNYGIRSLPFQPTKKTTSKIIDESNKWARLLFVGKAEVVVPSKDTPLQAEVVNLFGYKQISLPVQHGQ